MDVEKWLEEKGYQNCPALQKLIEAAIAQDRKEREGRLFCKTCQKWLTEEEFGKEPDPLSSRLERLRDIYEQRGYSGHSVNLQSRPTYAPRPYRCWWLVETDNEEEEEDIIYEGLTPLAAVDAALEEAEKDDIPSGLLCPECGGVDAHRPECGYHRTIKD